MRTSQEIRKSVDELIDRLKAESPYPEVQTSWALGSVGEMLVQAQFECERLTELLKESDGELQVLRDAVKCTCDSFQASLEKLK